MEEEAKREGFFGGRKVGRKDEGRRSEGTK